MMFCSLHRFKPWKLSFFFQSEIRRQSLLLKLAWIPSCQIRELSTRINGNGFHGDCPHTHVLLQTNLNQIENGITHLRLIEGWVGPQGATWKGWVLYGRVLPRWTPFISNDAHGTLRGIPCPSFRSKDEPCFWRKLSFRLLNQTLSLSPSKFSPLW